MTLTSAAGNVCTVGFIGVDMHRKGEGGADANDNIAENGLASVGVNSNADNILIFETRFRRRFSCFLPFLEQCRQAGYAVEEEGRWHLTPRGFLVSNQIIGGLLDALSEDKRRRADAAARGDFRVHLDET